MTHVCPGLECKVFFCLLFQSITLSFSALESIDGNWLKYPLCMCEMILVNLCCISSWVGFLGAVALTVGSVQRRIIPNLCQFHWLFIFNNQKKWRNNLGTILRGTDPDVSATAPCSPNAVHWSKSYVYWRVHDLMNVLAVRYSDLKVL